MTRSSSWTNRPYASHLMAIALGYRLHEGPALTFNGEQVIVAQALLWPGAGDLPEG